MATLTRRALLQSAALAASGMTAPLVSRTAAAAGEVTPAGKMTLAWHTNIATRWLDPQQHDGTATPDNFINAVHDALIKNFRDRKYDHPALAEHFEFPDDAQSATFRLRHGVKFHDGSPVTSEDVKWSYENYTGASAKLLHEKTKVVMPVDERTVRFEFIAPFLDFPILLGTANICGAGWVVPANYYRKVGREAFLQKPIGAGPYKLVSQEPGTRLVFEAFEDYYRPVHVKRFEILGIPEAATRLAMLEREEADIVYSLPGELLPRAKRNSKIMLAPVVSASWWLEFPGFQNPKNPFQDKRVRQAVSLAIDRKAINDAESGGWGKVSGNYQQRCRIRSRMAGVGTQCREGQGADERGRPPERVPGRVADGAPTLFSARRAGDLATEGDRHPNAAADHGARRLSQEARRRPQGMAGRADHHERGPHRRQLGQLVRRHVQMWQFPRAGHVLRQGPRREVRAVSEFI